MIYFVTNELSKEHPEWINLCDVETSLSVMKDWDVVQFDTETSGLDPHLGKLLSMQFGYFNRKTNEETQFVIDCKTIDPVLYKDFLETHAIVGHNLKFDLKWLYNYGIVPLKVCDTMITEQILYLGYKKGSVSFSLHDVVLRRLGIELDKTYQKMISTTGLTDEAIKYAAYDVRYLQEVMWSQAKEAAEKDCVEAVRIENRAVPAIAYLEWCGIHLNEDKWRAKMAKDEAALSQALQRLNGIVYRWEQEGYVSDDKKIVVPKEKFEGLIYKTGLGDLFTGEFDDSLHCKLNWKSSQKCAPFFGMLGFNTKVQDSESAEEKDSMLMKYLALQKGVCDELLSAYMDYSKAFKQCTTYGQSYLNAINPKTNRIHSEFKQIGADTSRMSSGSNKVNTDLAALKGLPTHKQTNPKLHCGYPQLQNLPHDAETRACFDAEPGNLICSCDFGSLESRLGADIYNEKEMLEEYLHGSGDMHSLVAKMIFPELKDVPVKEIKAKYPELRTKAKPVEFN